jgi:glycosyltransferase involved in cell wall biosynthesis
VGENTKPELTVIMPVYNEKGTIREIVSRVLASPVEIELLIVDDFSTDGTREIIGELAAAEPRIRLFLHEKNAGKGAAIKTAIPNIAGRIVIIQDADLEYCPEDYPALIGPIQKGYADVVYGTRFIGPHRVFMVWHYLTNKCLTILTNILYNTMLTDMEVGYKAFRSEIFKEITIRSNTFDFEPEVTAKVFKGKYRVFEVPITYCGRTYAEGKKITWRDGIRALIAILKYRFSNK